MENYYYRHRNIKLISCLIYKINQKALNNIMNKTESLLLEAYLSISKPSKVSPVEPQEGEEVNVGPMEEPAPGVEMNVADEDVPEETNSSASDNTEIIASPVEDNRLDLQDENEEDSMAISNLNSIRESIMKIASSCAQGTHLEPWQQQKLAIAMDNLAEVARRL